MSEIVERKTELPFVTPLADVYETEASLVVVMDLPGVSSSNLEINLQGSRLQIKAQAGYELKNEGKLLHCEFGPKIFNRVFEVHTQIDADKAEAQLKNGELRLVLPKIREEPRRIPIKID